MTVPDKHQPAKPIATRDRVGNVPPPEFLRQFAESPRCRTSQRKDTTIEPAVRFSLELPIPLGPDVQDPLARVHYAGYVVVAARLQQKNADRGIFRQTACDYRSRRTDPQTMKS